MPVISSQKIIKTARLSVVSNTLLTICKLITGVIIGSVSIISEAVHSLIDLIAALIAYIAVKKSSKPADDTHPYGYGKFENISGTIEALLIFIAVIYIIYESFEKLINPFPVRIPIIGVLVMLFSAFVNFFVSSKLFLTAKEADSVAIEADAWHLRTDVYTSLSVMVALLIITIVESFFLKNIYWLDSMAALLVAIMIIKTAWKLIMKSAKDLFDVSLPDEEVGTIKNIIRSNKNIAGYHAFKTRKSGNKRFVEFHILVIPKMTVYRSHEITRDLKANISSKLKNVDVTIHVEPCDNTCTPKCQEGCLIKIFRIENTQK
ncbi:MAG: cation diffusion facilitator family transporter [Endomicrobium sp.]|nr:cation diffusion facilitator family transporter [Endomicrobium sp.]